MPDFGIFRGFNEKLFGDKLVAGQLPTQLGLIGSEDATGFIGLLDTYPNAAAAYSLRKLRIGYTGDAIEVRIDTTGQPTYDIGFVDGELDTATLEGYCTGGLDAYVTTWYDQSGNGYDAIQGTDANQPQIVSSGSVILENGKPTVQFDGNNDNLQYAGEILNQSTFIGFVVCSYLNTTIATIFDQSLNNGGGLFATTGLVTRLYGITSSGIVEVNSSPNSNQTLYTGQMLSGNSILRMNGILKNTVTTTFTMSGNTGINFVIGDDSPPNGSRALDGLINELVIYTTDQNSNISGIETNINDFYSIYP